MQKHPPNAQQRSLAKPSDPTEPKCLGTALYQVSNRPFIPSSVFTLCSALTCSPLNSSGPDQTKLCTMSTRHDAPLEVS
jgi:hypothetical protein